ncbi:NADPH:quinone oxidoreductase family protein [Erythrobacter litoralis]|uniref:NADPH:quinone oxidoreductase family protein n=1 Tax=Erythrobacter litoralis TaxID=39960 RepID=UPI002435B20D|nr:NADPH:quinone oxidoreductase family protein [Erythrobacter litoralis]MDG6078381.1 NADPH:quinone oxidoreductase family protein [Erythrobacter litoralis]
MKAVVVDRLSDDLSGVEYQEIQEPEPKPSDLIVRVRAASLNYPDLLMTRGAYQFKPAVPFIAGMEMAGEIVEAPPDCGFIKGDRVMGGAKTGAFAERIALDPSAVRRIPEGLNFAEAAAFGVAYHTAYVALFELGQLKAGQTVLIHGASGGVGLAACDLAKALGATVIATTHSSDKLETLAALSEADHAMKNTGRFREKIARLTDDRLCDLVFDPVGGDVFDESTRCVAFGGKILVVGFVAGRIPTISVNIPLIKGFSIVGVRAGEYARRFPERAVEIARALDRLVENGAIRPHVHRVLPIAEWRNAFDEMAAGDLFGKIVLEP